MKINNLILGLTGLAFAISAQAEPPHLKKNEFGATQLIVDGKPMLMLAGEVNNSSGSDIEYMDRTFKSLRENNLNAALVSVSWEIIEPKEGVFDFKPVDELIRVARKNDMKMGILWFGSWKNGLSPYAPIWVAEDVKRFARVKDSNGHNTRTLTPLCEATREADAKAFNALLKHIAEIDSKQNTVLVVQVENEVGTLGQTRDFSDQANRLFAGQVPDELLQYLVKNKDHLEIEIKTAWEANGSKTKGTWTEVFGPGDQTDLFFMAWNYSRYNNAVAQAGKQAYNIPMYCNCWMPNPRPNPGKPGNYPSGGPILTVLDIWKAGAPFIDMLGPDLYGGDFNDEAHFFHRRDNPLLIPETNTKEGPAFQAFLAEDAICYSPFGIDSRGSVHAREYALLNSMMPVITKYQGSGKMLGIYRPTNTVQEIKLNDNVTINITFGRGGFGFRPRPASTNAPVTNAVPGGPGFGGFGGPGGPGAGGQTDDPPTQGIFVQSGENEFYLGGINMSVKAVSTNPNKEVWLKDAEEGSFVDGVWKMKSLQNGDEAGFLRGNDPGYRISPYRGSGPAVFRFKVAVYDR